jgi:hypothetical protein
MLRTYEERLDSDSKWALSEGSRHFERQSAVQQSLERIAKRLKELQVPYVGAMAMFYHGYGRFTEDVDVLVTKQGLKTIYNKLVGSGYVLPFERCRYLRDAETGVRIDFSVTGHFPGDGKPKPVAFPDPTNSTVEIHGIRCLALERIIELKLASGMTNPGRIRDLGDVQELIRHLGLGIDTAERLDSSVKGKYLELWNGLNGNRVEP